MDEIVKPWDRQPWDTDKSYTYFRDYYLSLDPKDRSVPEAYRRYRASRGYAKVDVVLPGSWVNWSRGANTQGKKPKGTVYEHAKSWQERSAAFDQSKWQAEQDLWMERRKRIVEQEWDLADRLIKRAEDMLKARLFTTTTDDNGRTVIIQPTRWDESDIGRTMDLAFKLQRRAAGMEQGKLTVEHDWKQQLETAGFDAGETFEKLVNEFVRNLAKPTDA